MQLFSPNRDVTGHLCSEQLWTAGIPKPMLRDLVPLLVLGLMAGHQQSAQTVCGVKRGSLCGAGSGFVINNPKPRWE